MFKYARKYRGKHQRSERTDETSGETNKKLIPKMFALRGKYDNCTVNLL